MNINCLEDSILFRIFNKLTIQDQVRCSSVCKNWLNLIESIKSDELIIYFLKPIKQPCSSVQVKTHQSFNQLMKSSKFRLLKRLKIHLNNQIIEEPTIDLTNFLELEFLEINSLSNSNHRMFEILAQKNQQLNKLNFLNIYRCDLSKLFDYFPNLTHIKTAFVDKPNNQLKLNNCKLIYFEQYHFSSVDQVFIDFIINFHHIEYLTVSIKSLVKIAYLIQNLKHIKELNFNISNQSLPFCFKHRNGIFKAMGKREIIFRINGLCVTRTDNQLNKFKVFKVFFLLNVD